MIVCPNCHKELSDGARFCTNCGEGIPQPARCPNCGRQVSATAAFCNQCGTPLTAKAPAQQPHGASTPVQQPYAASTPSQQPYAAYAPARQPYTAYAPVQQPYAAGAPMQQPAEKKKFPKKLFLFGGLGILLAAIAVAAVLLLTGKGSAVNYGLYIKEKQIFFTDGSKDGAWQLTSGFAERSVDDQALANEYYSIAKWCVLSEDGKTIFFPDRIGENDYGCTLYYKNVNDPKADAVKIDAEIRSYYVNDATTLVTYLKGSEGNLYQYDIKTGEKTKIGSEVSNYEASADGSKIGYLDRDYSMYYVSEDGAKEKLDTDVSYICRITEDYTTVYYMKDDDALYRYTVGKGKEKIASDVYSVMNVYESGEIYYCKSETIEIPMMNFVEDDLEPSEETYLRGRLEEETYSQKKFTLCYYDGTTEKVLTTDFNRSDYDYVYSTEVPVVVYKIKTDASVGKFKLSEFDSVYDLEDMIDDAQSAASVWYIAFGSAASEIEGVDAPSEFRLDSTGSTVFYIENVDEDKACGDLYRATVSDGKLQKAERYDTDVNTDYLGFVDDEQFLYVKDYKDGKGEVLLNKNRLDYDVELHTMRYHEDTKQYVYVTDYVDEKDNGTLKIFRDGKTEKIAEDVSIFELMPDGSVLYLSDYKNSKGTLYLYKNGSSERMDEDVVCIIPIMDTKRRGGTNIAW